MPNTELPSNDDIKPSHYTQKCSLKKATHTNLYTVYAIEYKHFGNLSLN